MSVIARLARLPRQLLLPFGLFSSSALVAQGAPPASSSEHSLFDGKTLAGWHGFKTPGKVPPGWLVEEGAITPNRPGDDLVTDKSYANFELTLEWKVAAKGNSGIIYRIDPKAEVTYTSGPEMQVLDDAGHPDGKSRLTSAGADYGLYPSKAGVVKAAGEWNSVRLVVNGNQVQHWLNGVKLVDYELGSADWAAKVKASKFKEWPGYGKAKSGFIGLQDHGDRVWFKNIRIKELP
jgi:hypothetical protein